MKIQYANVQPAVAVRDIDGREIVVNRTGDDATLVFLDLAPEANWAHPCVYLLVADGRVRDHVEHIWPPEDRLELHEVSQTCRKSGV